MLQVNQVQANVVSGHYSTVVNTETNEVLFCSTINGIKGEARPEAQAISFIKKYEKAQVQR